MIEIDTNYSYKKPSTEIIDLIHKLHSTVMNNKSKLDYRDNKFTTPSGTECLISLTRKTLYLYVYNEINYFSILVTSDVVDMSIRIPQIGFMIFDYNEYDIIKNQNNDYISTTPLKMMTEEDKFYHELNSSEYLNYLISYNSYVKNKSTPKHILLYNLPCRFDFTEVLECAIENVDTL